MRAFKPVISCVAALLLLTFAACNKDNVRCSSETAFCNHVADQNFDATIPLMNKFLRSLKKNDEEALEKLNEWLNCKECVYSSEIICNSCVYTLPAQSHIRIDFDVDGQIISQTLDVAMDEELKALRFHE
jgi:hypothetical protein